MPPKPKSRPWDQKTRGSLRDVMEFKNRTGAASLEDAAVRCIVQNLNLLDKEALSCVPWIVGRKIWACATRMQLISTRTWKIFLQAYPEERRAFQGNKKIPFRPFETFKTIDQMFKYARAPNFEWITHLAIRDQEFSRSSLCDIKGLSNLGLLAVFNEQEYAANTAVDDRVIKSWSIAAEEEGAFSRLRVLLFFHEAITNEALQFLAVLPALQLCYFCDTGVYWEGSDTSSAWRPIFQDEDEFEYNAEDDIRTDSFLGHYYAESFRPDLVATPTGEKNDMPVLTIHDDKDWFGTKYEERLWLLRTGIRQKPFSKDADTSPADEPQPKKRKVRASKEKSVGDVLGDMRC